MYKGFTGLPSTHPNPQLKTNMLHELILNLNTYEYRTILITQYNAQYSHYIKEIAFTNNYVNLFTIRLQYLQCWHLLDSNKIIVFRKTFLPLWMKLPQGFCTIQGITMGTESTFVRYNKPIPLKLFCNNFLSFIESKNSFLGRFWPFITPFNICQCWEGCWFNWRRQNIHLMSAGISIRHDCTSFWS